MKLSPDEFDKVSEILALKVIEKMARNPKEFVEGGLGGKNESGTTVYKGSKTLLQAEKARASILIIQVMSAIEKATSAKTEAANIGGYLVVEQQGESGVGCGVFSSKEGADERGIDVERTISLRAFMGLNMTNADVGIYPITAQLRSDIEKNHAHPMRGGGNFSLVEAKKYFVQIGKEKVISTKPEGQEAAKRIAAQHAAVRTSKNTFKP